MFKVMAFVVPLLLPGMGLAGQADINAANTRPRNLTMTLAGVILCAGELFYIFLFFSLGK